MEARPGPAPPLPRAARASPRRAAWVGPGRAPRARALEASPLPLARLSEAPPQSSRATAALRQYACAFVPFWPPLHLPLAIWSILFGPGGRGNRLRFTGKWAERGETQLRADWTRGTRLSPGLAKFDFLRGLVRPVGRAWRCNSGVEGRFCRGTRVT